MAELVLVGIDIGTSSTKAVVLAPAGEVLALAAQEYPVSTPRPGWAEQDPGVWVTAAKTAVRRAMRSADFASPHVAGISFSGQMHGLVCLDEAGHPLRPAIIWADQRSGAQVARVLEVLGRAKLAAWTGNPLATGFMLASWLWLQEHEPDIAAATRWLCLPKDYVRFRLTGEIGTEPSDAASTSMFNPATRAWSLPLLDALGLDAHVLPPIYRSSEVAGRLLPRVGEGMGVRAGIPVVYGGSDQAVQALGNGVVMPGVVSSTIGTGGQLFAPTERPIVDSELRMHSYCHVIDQRWHLETAVLSAGLSLRWLRDQILEGSDYMTLANAASMVPAGSDGLCYQPYLAGERTPHMDPRARASFVGLTRRHSRAHLIRAVMEGVVFGMRQGLDIMTEFGAPVYEVVASGGATRHPLWLQLQADIYNHPVRRASTTEAAATGAAMLAGMGVGIYADAREAISRVVRWQPDVVEPNMSNVAVYARQYEVCCDLYPALRPLMHKLHQQQAPE